MRSNDANQLLTAFMVGKSDGEDYGKLQVFVMPRGNLPNGPPLVQGAIQSDEEVGDRETILSGPGSSVSYGSLLAIPIDGGLVDVRPFYVTSEQTDVPGLEQVIVYFEGQVVIRPTLQEALEEVFGEVPPTLEEDPGTDPGEDPGEEPPPEGTVMEQVTQLLTEATQLFEDADSGAARRGAGHLRRADRPGPRPHPADAERLLEGEDGGATTTTTTDGASAPSPAACARITAWWTSSGGRSSSAQRPRSPPSGWPCWPWAHPSGGRPSRLTPSRWAWPAAIPPRTASSCGPAWRRTR